jgi:hypothetical protein
MPKGAARGGSKINDFAEFIPLSSCTHWTSARASSTIVKRGIHTMESSGLFAKVLVIGLMAAAPSSAWLHVAGMPNGKDTNHVATGTWGGEHIILEVSEKGAEVEFDCAHGQISQPMALNQQGDFDVLGTFSQEHGGPVRKDEQVTSNPARYSGRVLGDTMTLTVTRGKENVGTFTLNHGARANLRKCR